MSKQCCRCNVQKDTIEFSFNKRTKDGLQAMCKQCFKEYQSINREHINKQRRETKALIVLIADERSLLQYVASPHIEVFDYIAGVSKPTTIIYDNAIGLASNLIAEDGSVGIRICADEFCKHLIKRFRKPVVSTSANISGFPPPKVFSDIDMAVKQGVDYVVNYRQDDSTPVEPSAVVKYNKDGRFTILRP